MIEIYIKQKAATSSLKALAAEQAKLISVRFRQGHHLTSMPDNVMVISSQVAPEICLYAGIVKPRQLVIIFEKLLAADPHPLQVHHGFYSFELFEQSEEAGAVPVFNHSSFGFSAFQEIKSISFFFAQCKKDKDIFIEREYYDERDIKHLVKSSIDIDVALCLTLENKDSVILSYDSSSERYLVFVGKKKHISRQMLLQTGWLGGEGRILWKEELIWKNI